MNFKFECTSASAVRCRQHNFIYHMTRRAPRAISLENHKRKGPVRGPYASK